MMPSNQSLRRYDQILAAGVVALFALGLAIGFLFENWEPVATWMPIAAIALVIYLFYRFVLAVEYIAYES